jgi:hypothetical protein
VDTEAFKQCVTHSFEAAIVTTGGARSQQYEQKLSSFPVATYFLLA